MKLKFKHQSFQRDAARAVTDILSVNAIAMALPTATTEEELTLVRPRLTMTSRLFATSLSCLIKTRWCRTSVRFR